MEFDKQIVCVIVCFFIILFSFLLFFHSVSKPEPEQKTESRSKEWWVKRNLEIERRDHEEEFVSIFGFKPKLISQDRYRKEILLKLGLLAKEMKDKGEEVLKYPDVFRASYDTLSQEYSHMLELIGLYDPEFQQEIPHWTELSKFAIEWINRKKFKTSKVSTVT